MASHPALQHGRTALITGGSSGIGLATAKRCAALGMQVAILDLSVPAAASALGFTPEQAARVTFLQCDVTDHDSVAAAHAAALAAYPGGIHFLFLNAGIAGGGGPFTNLAGWKAVIDVNMWGVLNMLEQFMPTMLKQADESVVAATASRAGVTCPPGDTAYNVSKAAVKVIAESLQHRLRSTDGCKVTAHLLLPGMTHTNIFRATTRRRSGEAAAAKLPEADGTTETAGADAVRPPPCSADQFVQGWPKLWGPGFRPLTGIRSQNVGPSRVIKDKPANPLYSIRSFAGRLSRAGTDPAGFFSQHTLAPDG
jgi:NAD(P)-dependent dehydrogenase (short-subunit alcohol dehydrogenase family)